MATRNAQEYEREKLINKFIIRIFKGKALGVSRQVALIKVKKFIHDEGKKWTSSLQTLFDNTWAKKVPPEILARFNKDKPAKIMPNRVKVEPEAPAKIKPNVERRVKRAYVREEVDPEDMEMGPDEPEFQIKTKRYQCSNCDEWFEQSPSYPNRLLCPDCNEKSKNIFSWNNVYASELEAELAKNNVTRVEDVCQE